MNRDAQDLCSREDVEELVRAFYRQVATDDLLGPIFEGMAVDWPSHLNTLSDFWSWQLLGLPGYDGNPLCAHEPVHDRFPFVPEHYERWLELFVVTVDDGFAGPVAEMAKGRAVRMAHAMQRLLGGRHGRASEPIAVTLHP